MHRALVRAAVDVPGVTINDLYERYPGFDIDVKREQALLLEHDLIVMQHPIYWYSTPALLKQWQDLVLEHGWAYGSSGTALRGKRLINVVSSGGRSDMYRHDGMNRHTLREFLASIEQTASLCGMTFLPPYAVQGTHRMEPADIERAAAEYGEVLIALRDDRLDMSSMVGRATLNEALGLGREGGR